MPDPQFAPFKPILDRILIKLVRHEASSSDGLPDFQIPERFLQQTNKGEVLAVGDVVVLSQNKFPITEFVNVGDVILFGQFTAEEFSSEDIKKQYGLDSDDKIYVIRVQDVRGSSRKIIFKDNPVTSGVLDPVENSPIPSIVCHNNEQNDYYSAGYKDGMNAKVNS